MTLFTLFFTYMFHKTLVNIKNYLMFELDKNSASSSGAEVTLI